MCLAEHEVMRQVDRAHFRWLKDSQGTSVLFLTVQSVHRMATAQHDSWRSTENSLQLIRQSNRWKSRAATRVRIYRRVSGGLSSGQYECCTCPPRLAPAAPWQGRFLPLILGTWSSNWFGGISHIDIGTVTNDDKHWVKPNRKLVRRKKNST